ncbi:hypothetical protein [Bradyrhizobium icense]|uniref:hypothetical protein n=1 Tax=Bradyrhizobium icense TaxID=1274631 RepID=UPI0012EADC28|nr:hypothetical protein [Bradyrhizobium icense]
MAIEVRWGMFAIQIDEPIARRWGEMLGRNDKHTDDSLDWSRPLLLGGLSCDPQRG